MHEQPESFECSQCRRRFRWRPEIAGQTIRCACGAKVRCPLPADDTETASAASLEDTVADVVLEEAFDSIEERTGALDDDGGPSLESAGEVVVRRRVGGGIFGLGPAGETLFWGVCFLLGLSFIILAVIVQFWFYAAAALVCSFTAVKFYRSWTTWTRGRPWLECLAEAFGEAEDDKAGA